MRDDWVETTLGDVADVLGGGTPSTSKPEFWEGLIPWITPTEVVALDGKDAVGSRRTLTEQGLRASSANLLPAGTVLFTSRATIGAVCIAAVPMATNQGFASLVCGPAVAPRFLAEVLRFHKQDFIARAGGNTFLEISRRNVKAFKVRIPPLSEQHRIVDLMRAVDAEVTTATKTAESARHTRAALLSDLLSGNHEIPASYDRFLEAA